MEANAASTTERIHSLTLCCCKLKLVERRKTSIPNSKDIWYVREQILRRELWRGKEGESPMMWATRVQMCPKVCQGRRGNLRSCGWEAFLLSKTCVERADRPAHSPCATNCDTRSAQTGAKCRSRLVTIFSLYLIFNERSAGRTPCWVLCLYYCL